MCLWWFCSFKDFKDEVFEFVDFRVSVIIGIYCRYIVVYVCNVGYNFFLRYIFFLVMVVEYCSLGYFSFDCWIEGYVYGCNWVFVIFLYYVIFWDININFLSFDYYFCLCVGEYVYYFEFDFICVRNFWLFENRSKLGFFFVMIWLRKIVVLRFEYVVYCFGNMFW